MDVDTIIACATVRTDEDGQPIIEMAQCGTCGRTWNDAAVSSLTPTPSGRCPWEYEHEPETDEPGRKAYLLTQREAINLALLAEDEAAARDRHNLDGGDFDSDEIAELEELARKLRARWVPA